ncbi:hypothetical protein D3C81_1799350 [compost metagenome]
MTINNGAHATGGLSLGGDSQGRAYAHRDDGAGVGSVDLAFFTGITAGLVVAGDAGGGFDVAAVQDVSGGVFSVWVQLGLRAGSMGAG